MATREELIARLNSVLAWELAGSIQYMHYSALVTGVHRLTYKEFFNDGSEEARDHAEAVAEKIAALGGVPTMEPEDVKPALQLDEMLENTLELEQKALAAWEAALEIGDAVNIGTQLWIEEHVAEEQEHVDELMKITGKVGYAQGGGAAESESA